MNIKIENIIDNIKPQFNIFYVAVSGGKDSTATLIWSIKNLGRKKLFVAFADTGHEASTRYCTEKLKKEVRNKVLTDLINQGYEKICIVTGVRAEESEERGKYPVYEEERGIGILRPILNWSTEEVFDYLKENDIKPNPLYKKGCNRVGCFPCIFASAQEVRLLYEDKEFTHMRKKIEFLEKKIARPFFLDETLKQRYIRIKTGKYRERKKSQANVCNMSGIALCE